MGRGRGWVINSGRSFLMHLVAGVRSRGTVRARAVALAGGARPRAEGGRVGGMCARAGGARVHGSAARDGTHGFAAFGEQKGHPRV